MENLYNSFLNELKKSDVDAGETVMRYYQMLFHQKYSTIVMKQVRRLIRVYGKIRVFKAITRMYDSYQGKMDTLDLRSPYPLMAHFIRQGLESEYLGELEKESMSLKKYTEEYKKGLRKRTKLPDMFGEENYDS